MSVKKKKGQRWSKAGLNIYILSNFKLKTEEEETKGVIQN